MVGYEESSHSSWQHLWEGTLLHIRYLEFKGIVEITPKRYGDERGFFSEVYNEKLLKEAGINTKWVQDNVSLSPSRGTIRGLHFQEPPMAQDKLVRVSRGRILDVVVDIRTDSETFGKSLTVEISAEKWNQLLVPAGFAHGLITLKDNTEVHYKVSNFYSPEHDKGILWSDPELDIDWGVDTGEVLVSPKDQVQPKISEIISPF